MLICFSYLAIPDHLTYVEIKVFDGNDLNGCVGKELRLLWRKKSKKGIKEDKLEEINEKKITVWTFKERRWDEKKNKAESRWKMEEIGIMRKEGSCNLESRKQNKDRGNNDKEKSSCSGLKENKCM